MRRKCAVGYPSRASTLAYAGNGVRLLIAVYVYILADWACNPIDGH
jgi:hypothetical protein